MKIWISLSLACFLFVAGYGFHVWSKPANMPAFAAVKENAHPSYQILRDRNGKNLGEIRRNFSVRRLKWIEMNDISPAVISTFVMAEDKRFWRHGGVDFLALLHAVLSNPTAQNKRGASTITMQLAANLGQTNTGTKRKGIRGKIRQIRAAHALERRWSKQHLFEAWINKIDFRGEMQGIGAAAHFFAQKPAATITQNEALALAAMIPAPNAKIKRLNRRACALARRLPTPVSCAPLPGVLAKFVSPQNTSDTADLAFHVKQKLSGVNEANIATTLDFNLQKRAEQILAEHLRRLTHRKVRDGAILIADNHSGDILAWVGTNPATSKARHVDGVRAPRQAGSSLKPHLYALAIESRLLNASSILQDSQLELESIQGIYAPQNYDHRFVGPVSVRHALGNSMNIPAVKTLKLVGISHFIERLQALGYAGLDQSAEYYGFALALGSVEVSLFEQVQAYQILASNGQRHALRLRLNEPRQPAQQIISPMAAFITADMMADPAARIHTFGRGSMLSTAFGASVKTGTSKAMRDNWCVGFTPDYTVGVWVGNFDGSSMTNVSGTTGAAPIWNELMRALHQNKSPSKRILPKDIDQRPIRFDPPIEAARTELFIPGMGRDVIRVRRPADQTPFIAGPANNTVIALDPDIPMANQMVRFIVQGQQEGTHLQLNTQPIAIGTLWSPVLGQHQLRLLDKDGQKLDQVNFSVR